MDSHSHQNWVDFKNKLRSHEFCTNMALKQVLLEQRSVKERLQVDGTIKRKSMVLRAISENGVLVNMRRRLSTNGLDINKVDAAAPTTSSLSGYYQHRQKALASLQDDSNSHHGRIGLMLHTITEGAKTTPKSSNAENLMKMVRRGSDPLTDIAAITKKKSKQGPLLRSISVDDDLRFGCKDEDDKKYAFPSRLFQELMTSFSVGLVINHCSR